MHLRHFALLFVLVLSTTANAAEPPGIPDGWSDGYVYANGARLHYYHAVPAPEKPVIVMVHGVTERLKQACRLLKCLQAWHIIAQKEIGLTDVDERLCLVKVQSGLCVNLLRIEKCR